MRETLYTLCRESAAMGNAQDKPPGGGGGGAKTEHATPGRGRRSWGPGSTTHRPPDKASVVANGAQAGGGHTGGQQAQEVPVVDTSHLDAPAGALPPPLARLKNEGNHLFKNGQFGEALEKYTLAIDGCADAGSVGRDKVMICQMKSFFAAAVCRTDS